MAVVQLRRSYLGVADENLNIVEHFELVQARVEDLLKYAKGLISLLKKRIHADKEHVKAVQKLAGSVHEEAQYRNIKFQEALEQQWSGLKHSLQAEAMHLSSLSSGLERQALQPLQVYLLTDLEKRFRQTSHEGRRAVKDYHSATSALQKAKERYHSCTAEWEGSLLALYREYGDSWSPAPGNKLYEKEQLLTRKVQEARSEYEATVTHVNSLQHDVFLRQLPQALTSLRSTIEAMVGVVNTALRSFLEMQLTLIAGSSSEKPPAPPEQFNVMEYSQQAIFNGVSHDSIPPPPPYEFEEFNYKDQSLMVQARKVQYECISKLTPQEMISRGTQFFADADRRRSSNPPPKPPPYNPNGKPATPPKQGLQACLVEMCLEYLQQPVALKEEGIFRVPGDSSIIKSLHSQFMSGRTRNELLRQSVMEQRDPNNISGLLKLHLRENPLLPENCAALVQEALSNQTLDTLVESLVAKLPSAHLSLLTGLIQLLATLIQEPWKTDNKMTGHTLGIACGLSVFPQLEPGKAALLLNLLIKNNDELQRSHSVL